MVEKDSVVDVQAYLKERELQQSWEALAIRLAQDDRALEHFRDFMNNAVGHADAAVRQQEGLPLQVDYRGKERVSYTKEICSMIDTRGTVLHVREIDESQRWQERQQPSYSTETIFLRGKNYFVFSGNLFSPAGPSVYPVAQHHQVQAGDSQILRIQALPPSALLQPWLPVYRPDDASHVIEIIQAPSGASARFVGDRNGSTFRQVDLAVVDQIASHIAMPQIETYAVSS